MSAEIQQFQKISSKQNKIIAFGFPEEDKNKIYNSSAVFFPNSNISFVYRKTHLFYKERFCFDEGDSGFITRYDNERDINIGCMICYDWRFPEAARTLALQGSDLILCPSNLVTNVWTKVMPARSLENKVYLAVANRFGTEMKEDESLHFNGLSSIYAYNGDLLSQASADNEEIIYAEIFPDKTRNKQFNEINDIFADRRADMYKL